MRSRITALILGALVALSLTAALIPPQPAAAQPPPDMRVIGVSLSTTQWKAAGYVTKARNKAVSASGFTMDYRKMKTIFGKYTSWRRQMAAAHKQTHGRITHISKAEAKKVEAMRRKMYGKRKVIKPRSDSVTRFMYDGTKCKGKSGKVVVNRNETHKYYNSCETVDLKYFWGGCIGGMTFLGRFTEKKPKIDIPRYFIAAFCTFQLANVQRASDKSDIGAIYLRMYQQEAYQPYPGGLRYFIEYRLLPQ